MRIAHFGTFDVENYGDLLFPLILEHRLSGLGAEFVHVSPIGGGPIWRGCAGTIATDNALNDPGEWDGVVLGGGNLVHASASNLESYSHDGLTGMLAYPKLWLAPAELSARRGAPFVWNAPGVPGPLGPVASQLMAYVLEMTDYAAVRDMASLRFLQQAGVSASVAIVPDTALEISQIWSKKELDAAYRETFESRGQAIPERAFSFHINERYLHGESLASIANIIKQICSRYAAHPLLLALGPCHGDNITARELGKLLEPALVIDQPRCLRELVACLARSEAYIGSSLHGMITTLAFGRRGLVVASPEMVKFTGLLEQVALASAMTTQWSEASLRLDEIMSQPASIFEGVLAKATPSLDSHWRKVLAALSAPNKAIGSNKAMLFEKAFRTSSSSVNSAGIYAGILVEDTQRTHKSRLGLMQQVRNLRSAQADRLQNLQRLQQNLERAQQSLQVAQQKLENAQRKLDYMQPKLELMQQKLDYMQPKLELTQQKLDYSQKKLDYTQRKLDYSQPKLEYTRQKLERTQQELVGKKKQVLELSIRVEDLSKSLNSALHFSETLLESNYWKFVAGVARLFNRIRGQPGSIALEEQLRQLISDCRRRFFFQEKKRP